ncbi:MAG: FtsW/RodA/SpoVE family cell cycle protein [Planctomycetes bacterium]|nr:FtsW/RodA/SpoVE family cell cycle protein [Planctomycetota bacterium]
MPRAKCGRSRAAEIVSSNYTRSSPTRNGRSEWALGHGGQLHSFEAVFSPRGKDGKPLLVWDRKTGKVNTEVAKTWEKYDIRLILERNWKTRGPKLKGKLHVFMGDADTFYLEGATILLKESHEKLKTDAVVEIHPGKNHGSLKALIGPFAFTLLPIVLILAEPDLGTVLLLMPILFVMLFVAGAEVKHLLLVIIAATAISPFLWRKMPSYQRQRISSVLLQNEKVREATEREEWLQMLLADRGFSAKRWMNDSGYQLIRSKDAIASAGWTGYGFRRGPFMKYNFLPDRETDFIFASIAHQWGFLGCMVLLALYAVIVICGLRIAANNTDPFGRLVAVGILTMFVIEVFVNISMTVGVMPITGLTLPFVSYGGSSLMVNLMSVGLLNNIGRCRAFTVAKTE